MSGTGANPAPFCIRLLRRSEPERRKDNPFQSNFHIVSLLGVLMKRSTSSLLNSSFFSQVLSSSSKASFKGDDKI